MTLNSHRYGLPYRAFWDHITHPSHVGKSQSWSLPIWYGILICGRNSPFTPSGILSSCTGQSGRCQRWSGKLGTNFREPPRPRQQVATRLIRKNCLYVIKMFHFQLDAKRTYAHQNTHCWKGFANCSPAPPTHSWTVHREASVDTLLLKPHRNERRLYAASSAFI